MRLFFYLFFIFLPILSHSSEFKGFCNQHLTQISHEEMVIAEKLFKDLSSSLIQSRDAQNSSKATIDRLKSFKYSVEKENVTTKSLDHLSHLAQKKMFELLSSHGDKFNVNRFLDEYIASFGPSFLKKLREGGHWIDAGAGNLKAIEDFHSSTITKGNLRTEVFWKIKNKVKKEAEKLKITGASFKVQNDFIKANADNLDVVIKEGFFEENTYEPFDVLTDYYGVAAYTPYLDEAFKVYFKNAKPNAEIYMVGFSIHKDLIIKTNGEIETLADFLFGLKGIDIKETKLRDWIGHEGLTSYDLNSANVDNLGAYIIKILDKDEISIPNWSLVGIDETRRSFHKYTLPILRII